MTNILYVKCNMKDSTSSRTIAIGDHFINKYLENNPDSKVTEVDLFASDIPGIDKDVFSAWNQLRQGKDFTALSDAQKTETLQN